MDPAFKGRRWTTLTVMLEALTRDDDDIYCEGYDALCKAEKDAGEFDGHDPGVCRVCGCTDLDGCEDGCAWVDEEHTLCSACTAQTADDQRQE